MSVEPFGDIEISSSWRQPAFGVLLGFESSTSWSIALTVLYFVFLIEIAYTIPVVEANNLSYE